jgi:rod shape-determining protein MreC
MNTILQLFIRNGGFLTLVLVEAFCFYVIVQNNERQRAIYFHSLGRLTNNMLEKERRTLDYFRLQERADSLQAENARLLTLWENARQVRVPYRDTFFTATYDSIAGRDSLRRRLVRPLYEFIPAQVIGNTVNGANNWLIINRGSRDEISNNSAVISAQGLVGIVWHVDPDFAMVMSLLHRETKISAALKRQRSFGSLVWEGGDPAIMTLKFIPKHVEIRERDTVVTSGYSQIFPKDVLIGTVEGKVEQDPENPYFVVARVRLSQDLSQVGDVYVVNNLFRPALDSLKQRVTYEQ